MSDELLDILMFLKCKFEAATYLIPTCDPADQDTL